MAHKNQDPSSVVRESERKKRRRKRDPGSVVRPGEFTNLRDRQTTDSNN